MACALALVADTEDGEGVSEGAVALEQAGAAEGEVGESVGTHVAVEACKLHRADVAEVTQPVAFACAHTAVALAVVRHTQCIESAE